MKFIGKLSDLGETHIFQGLVGKLYNKEWIVYCKPPFKSAEYVVQYLGRYTHRVAVSNDRIEFIDNGYIVFRWRDYKDNNKEKHMTITAEEFIRRFLMHILPDKFVKIRHYGILGNRNKKTKLKNCKRLTGLKIEERFLSKKLSVEELMLKITGIEIRKCPCCSKGTMTRKLKLNPTGCSPPNI